MKHIPRHGPFFVRTERPWPRPKSAHHLRITGKSWQPYIHGLWKGIAIIQKKNNMEINYVETLVRWCKCFFLPTCRGYYENILSETKKQILYYPLLSVCSCHMDFPWMMLMIFLGCHMDFPWITNKRYYLMNVVIIITCGFPRFSPKILSSSSQVFLDIYIYNQEIDPRDLRNSGFQLFRHGSTIEGMIHSMPG
jgi:hypothetical protein